MRDTRGTTSKLRVSVFQDVSSNKQGQGFSVFPTLSEMFGPPKNLTVEKKAIALEVASSQEGSIWSSGNFSWTANVPLQTKSREIFPEHKSLWLFVHG